jgi:hypothetical protein
MNKKEEEIQRKLVELETSVLKEQTDLHTVSDLASGSSLSTAGMHASGAKSNTAGGEGVSVKSDGLCFAGLASIFCGLMLVFQHVRVGSGLLAMLGVGSGGFALLFLPLMVGIGMMFYDYRNKWAWVVTTLSCVLLIFAFLATLTVTFPGVSMMSLIVMFLPFALGAAFLVKGVGGAKGVEGIIKAQLPKKEG